MNTWVFIGRSSKLDRLFCWRSLNSGRLFCGRSSNSGRVLNCGLLLSVMLAVAFAEPNAVGSWTGTELDVPLDCCNGNVVGYICLNHV